MGRQARERSERRNAREGACSQCKVALDTCTILDALSIHDLWDLYEEQATREVREPAKEEGEAEYRRKRARDALILLLYLDETQTLTFYPATEMIRKLLELVPPKSGEYPSAYARFLGHHGIEVLFPNWRTVSDMKRARIGSRADRRLVRLAAQWGVPVVTSEVKPKGALRRSARQLKVRVFTPREYWEPSLSEKAGVERLIARWEKSKRELFQRALTDYGGNYDQADHLVGYFGGYLRHVLLGETRQTT